LLLGKSVGRSGRLIDRRQRGARVCNRRLGGGLSASLRLLTITVQVIVATVQVEGSELHSSSVDFAVAGHAHSFLLVQDTALVARHTSGTVSGGLDRSGGIATCGCCLGLVLLVRCGEGSSRGAGRVLSRVP
jgi:hypothetical protein